MKNAIGSIYKNGSEPWRQRQNVDKSTKISSNCPDVAEDDARAPSKRKEAIPGKYSRDQMRENLANSAHLIIV